MNLITDSAKNSTLHECGNNGCNYIVHVRWTWTCICHCRAKV